MLQYDICFVLFAELAMRQLSQGLRIDSHLVAEVEILQAHAMHRAALDCVRASAIAAQISG